MEGAAEEVVELEGVEVEVEVEVEDEFKFFSFVLLSQHLLFSFLFLHKLVS